MVSEPAAPVAAALPAPGVAAARYLHRSSKGCLALSVALVVSMSAQAQSLNGRLSGLVANRVEGDRSGACVQAARVELNATTQVVMAAHCARFGERSVPLGARFEIGSISKAFVGVLAAEMAARGELRLDEPIDALLPPEAAGAPAAVRALTFTDLLTHTSGLPPLPLRFKPANGANPYADLTAAVVYGSLADVTLPPVTPPATARRYAYSNWAFLLLSDLLARRAGKPYDALLRERVLQPLGMNDTLVASNDGLVPGHRASGDVTPAWDVPIAFAGAGGLRSTLDDLLRLSRAVLGELPVEATLPSSLQRALVDSLQPLRQGPGAVMLGLAWHRAPLQERVLVYHSGMTGGFAASLVLDPAQRRAGIVLADAAQTFEDLAIHLVAPEAPLLLAARPVALDLPLAQAAAGRYQLGPQFVLALSVDDGKLWARATGQGRFELRQDARGDFYATVADILVRFDRTADGKVSGLTLFQGGGAVKAARID